MTTQCPSAPPNNCLTLQYDNNNSKIDPHCNQFCESTVYKQSRWLPSHPTKVRFMNECLFKIKSVPELLQTAWTAFCGFEVAAHHSTEAVGSTVATRCASTWQTRPLTSKETWDITNKRLNGPFVDLFYIRPRRLRPWEGFFDSFSRSPHLPNGWLTVSPVKWVDFPYAVECDLTHQKDKLCVMDTCVPWTTEAERSMHLVGCRHNHKEWRERFSEIVCQQHFHSKCRLNRHFHKTRNKFPDRKWPNYQCHFKSTKLIGIRGFGSGQADSRTSG